jgi:ribosomal protein S8
MTYDIKKMKTQLVQLGNDLKSYEKGEIAAAEQVSTETLSNYFKGEKIPTLALGAAIIKRGTDILKNRDN